MYESVTSFVSRSFVCHKTLLLKSGTVHSFLSLLTLRTKLTFSQYFSQLSLELIFFSWTSYLHKKKITPFLYESPNKTLSVQKFLLKTQGLNNLHLSDPMVVLPYIDFTSSISTGPTLSSYTFRSTTYLVIVY